MTTPDIHMWAGATIVTKFDRESKLAAKKKKREKGQLQSIKSVAWRPDTALLTGCDWIVVKLKCCYKVAKRILGNVSLSLVLRLDNCESIKTTDQN